ncbi:hypothetical protein, partial [Synechocystis salina]|uniref:hypothetical protein n=1 Tax=Synechocystis salina TaxID=945780 RepID=UPI001D14A963
YKRQGWGRRFMNFWLKSSIGKNLRNVKTTTFFLILALLFLVVSSDDQSLASYDPIALVGHD